MKMLGKNIYIRIAAVIMTLFMVLILPGETAFAAPVSTANIDMSKKGSLTVAHLSVDEELMANVQSHLYLVATIDEKGQYTVTEQFAGFFTDSDCFNNGFDYDAWKQFVSYEEASDSDNLLAYIKENNISPVAEKLSEGDGKTYYTDLELGVYYVLSDKVEAGGYTHSFVNFLYPVPILEMTETGNVRVNYNPSASPKKSKIASVHCSLRKRWSDSGNTANRPQTVTFRIYCDGEFMEEVTLSSENDWYYEWGISGDHTFSVEEVNVASGYSSDIQVVQNGHDFEYVCTNSFNPPPPGDNPPPPGDNPPGDTPPGIPDLPEVLGAIRDLPQVLGARRLPQTGQLWWPLPILVIAGVFLIVKGIRKNSKNA
ncbi:MAG: Cna B-type domain-containing protein [Butyrivibrio sp.]|nr:Cna B-type domain-containing protein [Butyrivibrio sp.]